MKFMTQKIIIVLLALFGTITGSAASSASPIVKIQHWQSAEHGVPVYFVHEPGLPMVDILVAFHAGSARDGAHYGLAALTSQLLFSGTPALNVDQIALGFENLGAQYGTSVDRDKTSMHLRCLSDQRSLRPAVALFSRVLAEASMPQDSFKRKKAQLLTAIKHQEQSPGTMASRSLYKSLYGKQPYAHPVMGLVNTVNKLTRSQVNAFYKQYYVANNALVVIVGDLNRREAQGIAKQLMQRLPAGEKAPKLAQMKRIKHKALIRIPYTATQTHIRIGEIAISRDDPDYIPLSVGNYILGGGALVSRLFSEVREKQGLSYSVYSTFVPLQEQGLFYIGLQTQKSKTKKALALSQQVLHEFLHKGPTQAELVSAKKHIIGSFPLRISSNSAILSNVLAIAFYGLPLDYLDTYRDKVTALNVKAIYMAFKKRINPRDLATIVVGDSA